MANGSTNTIIIRDETRGTSKNEQQIKRKDFDNNGTLKPKSGVVTTKSKGRPANPNSAELSKFDRTRPFTPLLNRLTGGAYERGRRSYKSLNNLFQVGYGVGFNILAKEAIDFVSKAISQLVNDFNRETEEKNNKDNLRFRTGDIKMSGDYKVSTNFWTGRRTYKSNR